MEAKRRLARDGPNELPRQRPRPVSLQFLGELVHFFAIMLWVASALAWLADLPELTVAIIAVIFINATFSFIQERRSDRAAERLQDLMPHTVSVFRDGHRVEIDARHVVVGDLLLLEAGDRICSDARWSSTGACASTPRC